MPFIGRDWRGNGEQWIKTEIGSWERPKKVSLSNSSTNTNLSLSDIFNALDIANSVTNVRRFNYISKVVQILIKEKLGELSGNAQRTLFQIIDRMVDMVVKTGDKISFMQQIVTQFHNSIHSAYPFYYYIGSAALWRQHIEMLTQMKEKLDEVQTNMIKSDNKNDKFKFDYLPLEIQRHVIKKLDNGTDIINIGMVNLDIHGIAKELFLWKRLCYYHFDDKIQNDRGGKLLYLMKQQEHNDIDWKKIYFLFKKQYELREIYPEMIYQCQLCKCLYWQNSEHLCPYEKSGSPSSKPIIPRKLVNMLILKNVL